MKFYPHTIPGSAPTQTTRIGLSDVPVTYQYSITPADGKAWVVFLSDSDSKNTTFATIQINGTNATLKTFDSDTGSVTRTLRLTKWSN